MHTDPYHRTAVVTLLFQRQTTPVPSIRAATENADISQTGSK
jgi:hypothetical protein